MARLLIHVEGFTEKEFVNRILLGHLVAQGYHSVAVRFVGESCRGGGIRKWPSVRDGVLNHLKTDRNCFATTMVDFYALPHKGPEGWPGRARAATLATTEEKGKCVQEAMLSDLAVQMGPGFDISRFVPFVVMHEFEGLLFSDCGALSRGIVRPELEDALRYVSQRYRTPEDIDDSPSTAPSKVIEALAPRYQKPVHGLNAAEEIGLPGIRAECPHFNTWLTRLEALAR